MKAIITGATKGMGKAIARKFAAAGFDLLVTARNEQELSACAAELQQEFGIRVSCMPADLGDAAQLERFCLDAARWSPDTDVLINNMGTYIQGGLLDEKEDTLDKMLSTNLVPAYRLTRHIAQLMTKRRKGHIFNVCSIASIEPVPAALAYSVSKFALLGFTKSIREELKPFHIKVTAIIPGSTLTSSWEGTDVPPERFILPEDVASAIYSAWQMSGGACVDEIRISPALGNL